MGAALPDDFASRAAALQESVSAERPTSWRPDDADQHHPNPLVGVLVRVDEGHTPYGPAKIVVLRTPTGDEYGVWLLHAVLKGEFARLRPHPGELVAVRYLGTVPPRDGRAAYESYRVIVDREQTAGDWNELAGDVHSQISQSEAAASPLVAATCEQCGCVEPDHAAGCELEIPF